MSWNDFVYGLGDLIYASFELLKAGNDYVNWFYIVAVTVVLTGWVIKQVQYNKEAERTGSLK